MVNRCMRQGVLGVFALGLLAASAVGQTENVRYVDADVTCDPDAQTCGQTWATAYRDLQGALAEAASEGTVTEIWVAEGTYMPDGGVVPLGGELIPGSGTQTATFQLLNGVALYGGFAGGETLLSQRNPTANETILSGDLNSDDAGTGNAENSYHVVTGTGRNETAVLDGFTVTAGNANVGAGNQYGAGILVFSGNPSISNCKITGNVVNYNNGWGGGVYAPGLGSPLSLVNCVFSGNSAKKSNGKGGGLYVGNADLSDCVFQQNVSDSGGGVYAVGTVSFANCRFTENDVTGGAGSDSDVAKGGGVFCASNAEVSFTGCTFARNTAPLEGGGIGLDITGGSAAITDCLFLANQGGFGGGINGLANAMTLTNSVFIANTATSAGGGVGTSSNGPHVTNCTFVGNSSGKGGGLCATASDGQPAITNCIFWHNSDSTGMGETGQINRNSGSAPLPVVNYCLIQGLSGALGGTGNFDSDPLFVDANGDDDVLGTEDDNVRLLAGSPAIDAGNDAAVPTTVTTDFDGNPRIGCAHVDLGAFESTSGSGGATITCPADVEIECGVSTDPNDGAVGMASATDGCSGASVPTTFSDSVAAGDCPGESTITRTWTTAGGSGEPASCNQVIMIVDTTPPELICPSDVVTAPDAGGCAASGLELGSAIATDCGGVSVTNDAPAVFLTGETVVTWTAIDGCGNTTECQQIVTVSEPTEPFLTSSVTQTMLWPPNHEMVDVGLSVTIIEGCASGSPTVTVYANEDDEEDTGDGVHSPDALDIASGTLRLRAERKGDGGGRIYLIVVQAEDVAGNLGTATCTVVVPHDRSRASLQAATAAAAAAQAGFDGTAPVGFVVVGDGPLIGPNQ